MTKPDEFDLKNELKANPEGLKQELEGKGANWMGQGYIYTDSCSN